MDLRALNDQFDSKNARSTTLEIHSAADLTLYNWHKHTIAVTYPSHWLAPIKLSPFAVTIEEETIHWMSSIHLAPDSECYNHIRNMEPRHYAGYSHSMAAYDHALMYCKYITMWLLWDDQCVEPAQNLIDIELPLRALAGEHNLLSTYDPYVIAFRHIGDEYERLGASCAWRIRFADKMREWAYYAVEEEKIRRLGTINEVNRSFEEAVRLRAITVGIRPNSITLERAVGIELPDTIVQSSEYQLLIDKAALICCIINDIVGVPKDLLNQQIKSNLILYHRMCFNTSLQEAYYAVLALHDEAVLDYDCLAQKLLENCPSDFKERLSVFIDHLRYMDTGFGFWHRDCVRYQNWIAGEENYIFRIEIHGR